MNNTPNTTDPSHNVSLLRFLLDEGLRQDVVLGIQHPSDPNSFREIHNLTAALKECGFSAQVFNRQFLSTRYAEDDKTSAGIRKKSHRQVTVMMLDDIVVHPQSDVAEVGWSGVEQLNDLVKFTAQEASLGHTCSWENPVPAFNFNPQGRSLDVVFKLVDLIKQKQASDLSVSIASALAVKTSISTPSKKM